MKRVMTLAFVIVALTTSPPVRAQGHGDDVRQSDKAATQVTGAGHGDADHGPSYKLISIDGMTAVWTIIIFVILLIVLRAFAWKPIQKALVDREDFIRNSLEEAQRDREEAEARLKEYTAQLEAARKDASAIVEEGRRDADAVKAAIEQRARDEAAAMLARAKQEITLAKDSAVKEIYTLSAKLATGVAARIIQKELNEADHERLISESIRELTETGTNARSLN